MGDLNTEAEKKLGRLVREKYVDLELLTFIWLLLIYYTDATIVCFICRYGTDFFILYLSFGRTPILHLALL
jgi:hypothetical protein